MPKGKSDPSTRKVAVATEKKLDAFRTANFNWTLHLQNIWIDQPHHVPGLQPTIETEFSDKLTELRRIEAGTASPLGWVLVGPGGVGKTHLLSNLRSEAARQGCAFILVDMTDVNDFWETVAVGYTNSLQEEYIDGRSQYQFILHELIARISTRDKIEDNYRTIVNASPAALRKHSGAILNALRKRHRRETLDHHDAVRALIATNAEDFEVANLGQMWLQGLQLEPSDAKTLGLSIPQQRPSKIVAALSWIISLSNPTVVAFDQLDPIVRQLEYEAEMQASEGNETQEAVANSIISGIGDGLRSMYDITRRSLTVLSCLESSWNILQSRVLQSSSDRFESARALEQVRDAVKYREIVASRMRTAAHTTNFAAPYDTWPFAEAAFDTLANVTPRELLKRCEGHRKQCIARGDVTELTSFAAQRSDQDHDQKQPNYLHLEEMFEGLRDSAVPAALLDPKNEESFAEAIRAICSCLLVECETPENVDAVLDTAFTGGKNIKPLHARIRLIFHSEEEREEHYSVRILQHANACAFQNRLKLATTQSGIDKSLSFRHLTIIRRGDAPSGPVTRTLTKKFEESGGSWYSPSDDCLRVISALGTMLSKNEPHLADWLRYRKPASQTQFCKQAFPGLFLQGSATRTTSESTTPKTAQSRYVENETHEQAGRSPITAQTAAQHGHVATAQGEQDRDREQKTSVDKYRHFADEIFPLGHRLFTADDSDVVSMPLRLLNKHAVVLAGAGSGKTVLLKRMVEEAALRGIPSIVLDGANDLAALGDMWPERPSTWSEEDAELAEKYHRMTEPVIWTPGKQSGRPLRLELIPDLSATLDDPDELNAAVAMVAGALADILALGASKNDRSKFGILSRSLRFFIEQRGIGLEKYIELLSDLPDAARLDIAKEATLAKELSDSLRVLTETDPMISDSGDMLDPAILFGDDQARSSTRISIINFSFLPSDESQLRFVNQLATTLFAWIKKHPNPPGRCLRGLLVIDEAKDLVPGRRSTPCKESLIRLTAQARKYQLGLVYATQNPREIDNTIIGNCSTQYYGKASSPAAISTIKQQLAERNGSGDDVGRLEKGTFYVFNADAEMKRPVKVKIPMCLSHHQTLDADGVLERIQTGRGQTITAS